MKTAYHYRSVALPQTHFADELPPEIAVMNYLMQAFRSVQRSNQKGNISKTQLSETLNCLLLFNSLTLKLLTFIEYFLGGKYWSCLCLPCFFQLVVCLHAYNHFCTILYLYLYRKRKHKYTRTQTFNGRIYQIYHC